MSRIKGITIELDGDTKGLDKALSDVNKRSRDVATELRQVDRLLKFNPGNTELIAQKQKLLGDQVEATRGKLDQLKEAEAQVQAQFAKGDISEEQYRAFQREIVETESKLKHYESQLESTKTKLEQFGEKSQAVGEKMKSAGDKMQDIGKGMSMKVTAPLAGAAAAAIKVGTDFETSMSNVAAVSGAAGDDLQTLEDKAREMGATTNKSASEAADAMGYMALAGWDTEEMLTGIEPMLKLSSAGNIDLAKASDLVTDSMSAMGIGVDELDHYLDVMAKTSQSSNTDVEQLGDAFVTAGGKMQDLGIDFEEGSVALGLMADAGIKGSEAGRGLSAILTNLTHPTGATKKAMDELGLSVFDANGDFIGIEESLKLVDGALEGMTQEQQNSYKSMIAGKEHAKTFSALMNSLGDDYDNLTDEVSNATGALDEMYEIMTDNLKGRWDEFKSALEEAGIAIFKALQPALEIAVGLVTKLVGIFNALPAPIQAAIVTVGAIVAAIGPLLAMLGFMISNIGSLLVAVPKIIAFFGSLGKVFAMVKTAAAVVGTAIGGISAPVLAVIAAVAALVAIGVALYKNWDTVKEYASIVWEAIADFLIALWEGIAEVASSIWGGITDFFSATWDVIKEVFFNAVQNLKEALDWQAIFETIKEIWSSIQEFFAQIWEVIKNIFVGAFIVLLQLITGQWEEAGETTRQIWENITKALSKIWDAIKNVFKKSFELVMKIVKDSWKFIEKTFTDALNLIDKLTGGKFKLITDTVRNYMKMVSDNLKAVWDFIKNTFNNALDFVKALVSSDFGAMRTAIQNQMNNVKNLITTIWNNIKSFFTNVINNMLSTVKQKFTDIYNSVRQRMLDVFTNIKEVWDKVMNFLRGINLRQIGIDIIKGLINGVKSMATSLIKSMTGVVGDAINGAKKLLGIASPSKVFYEIGEFTGEGLEGGLRAMGGRVQQASEDMTANTIVDTDNNPMPVSGGNNNPIPVGGGDIIINIESMNVRNDDDIRRVSRELQSLIERNRRGRGGGL